MGVCEGVSATQPESAAADGMPAMTARPQISEGICNQMVSAPTLMRLLLVAVANDAAATPPKE